MADSSDFEGERFSPEPPHPLFRVSPPPEPYPLWSLPQVLQDGVNGIVGRVQCPPTLAAQSVLGAATLAAQPRVDVQLHTGQRRPVQIFMATVAASGERKSSADNEANAPTRSKEAVLREHHDAASEEHRVALTTWSATEKRLLKALQDDGSALEEALRQLGPPPKAPPLPVLLCGEPTFEGLSLLLQDGPGHCGVFSAEGGQFVGGHAMNADNKLKSAAALSDVWDGNPLRRVRRADGVTVLHNRRVSMHLMLQQHVAWRFLSDRVLIDQGLLSRFLISAPVSTMGTRFGTRTEETEQAMRRYFSAMHNIWDRPIPVTNRNELQPRLLRLSDEAQENVEAFACWVEQNLAADGCLRPISGFANKLAEHAVRLAGVFQFISQPDAIEIAGDVAAGAIALARWFATESLRLNDAGAVSPELNEAEHVRLWLLNTWPEAAISVPDLQQRGPSFVRDNAKAHAIIRLLAEHGWLIEIPGGSVIQMQRRREAWIVVREPRP